MPVSFPIGFQVGGRAARDKVAGGAWCATDVGKDECANTPAGARLQEGGSWHQAGVKRVLERLGAEALLFSEQV
jgi:hypothetical protein